MNKICTSLDQSKKLIELGIDIHTADMCYRYRWHNNNFMLLPCIEPAKEPITGDIPAWSLAALLSVLPLHLIVNNQRYAFSMIKGLDKNGETYAIKYAIFNTTFYFHLTDYYNNPIDACYEMILKLKEKNLL